MGWTDDPHADYDRWEREQWQQEQNLILPTCAYCAETLEDYLYNINGELLCEKCMNEHYREDASEHIQTAEECLLFDED